AIHHHPATKHVMPVRLAVGFPTIFNLLGPLTNPAGARRQVMGVYEERFIEPIAEALRKLGALKAMVVHSEDGLDELSISAPTRVAYIDPDGIRVERLDPTDLGLTLAGRETVLAGDLDHAARLVREVLDGTETGPPRDMTLLSAAATLLVADAVPTMTEGVERAAATIDDGRAAATLAQLAALSHEG
ncbi:MAG: anthranilate phosphoribosyltransferase, partial [Planctomycetes bacterium]|nr:anthranilate phosphoribosyltransferase [Planctomycetota bacterium]